MVHQTQEQGQKNTRTGASVVEDGNEKDRARTHRKYFMLKGGRHRGHRETQKSPPPFKHPREIFFLDHTPYPQTHKS